MSERTHGYVATMGCGCGVGICTEDSSFVSELDEWRDQGLLVRRLTIEECRAAFLERCSRYPHTAWQIRNEKARARRLAKPQGLPL